MAALTFAQAKTLISNVVGESDTAFTDDIGTWLNEAQRDINRAHPWPSMLKRDWVITVEPYTEGTVAIATNSTALLGSGTTFTPTMVSALYRWAPSYSDPWNYGQTWNSATSITLSEAYRGPTLTATPTLLYKVDYSLPSDCETVEKINLHDHNDGEIIELPPIGDRYMERWSALPEFADRPVAYTDAVPPLSDGTKQIRIGPAAPDDTYRLEVIYRKQTTDGSASLPQDLEDLWICRAKAYAYERDHFDKYLRTLALYESMLADKWNKTRIVAEEALSYGQERLRDANRDEFPVGFNFNSLEIP